MNTLLDNVDWFTVAQLQVAEVLRVEDGNHGEYRPRPHEFVEGGDSLYIRAADMNGDRILFDSAKAISDIARQRIRKGIGAGGDILFSHKGTVGKVALAPLDAPEFVCSPQTTFWRTLDESKLDRRFLFAYLRSPFFIRQWFVRKGETDMADYVSLTAQRELSVPLPPIEWQRRVGLATVAVDDLIENNRRRIEILEEMARLVYREWFVHFRFPGHEDVELIDSDLGPIPEGWLAGEFSDLVSEITATLAPEEIPESTPVVGLEHLPRRSTTLREWQIAADVGSRRKTFVEGDILFGKIRPYFHKVVDASISGCASTDAIVFRPKDDLLRCRALAVASSDEFVGVATATSNGTKMPRANSEILMAYRIPHPTQDVDRAFSEIVQPMDSLRKTLARKNRVLREARDLLLPRLVSGDLDVSELDLGLASV